MVNCACVLLPLMSSPVRPEMVDAEHLFKIPAVPAVRLIASDLPNDHNNLVFPPWDIIWKGTFYRWEQLIYWSFVVVACIIIRIHNKDVELTTVWDLSLAIFLDFFAYLHYPPVQVEKMCLVMRWLGCVWQPPPCLQWALCDGKTMLMKHRWNTEDTLTEIWVGLYLLQMNSAYWIVSRARITLLV